MAALGAGLSAFRQVDKIPVYPPVPENPCSAVTTNGILLQKKFKLARCACFN
jgi:hypothetical protein